MLNRAPTSVRCLRMRWGLTTETCAVARKINCKQLKGLIFLLYAVNEIAIFFP